MPPPWTVGLLIFAILLGLCYLAAMGGICGKGRKPAPAESLVAAVLGLVVLGFAVLLARWASVSVFACFALLVVCAALTIYRRRALSLPEAKVSCGQRDLWITLSLAAAFALPSVFGGLTMALGEYPEVFFHAATPFRLTHAYQLVEDRGIPPLSLSNHGVRIGNHYGAPSIGAAVALFTGLPVHTSFFLSLIAVTIGAAAMAYLLTDRTAGRLPYALRFCFILGAAPLTVWSTAKSITRWTDDPQLFLNHFPDISIMTGTFLFLVVLYACLDLQSPRKAALGLVATVVLSAANSSFFAAAGILLFAATLVRLYRTRDWRWLLLPLMAFLAGYSILQPTGSAITTSLKLEPFFLFSNFGNKALGYGMDLVLFSLPPLIYVWAARPKLSFPEETQDRLIIVGLSILGLLTFLNLFGHYYVNPKGEFGPNSNILHPLKLLPKLLAIFSVLIMTTIWDPTRRRLNLVTGVMLVLIAAVPLSHRVTQAFILLLQPEAGHEYADNRSIAEALQSIPVDGSIIVTNDLRYPANDFKRDLRQMQIPALFGHQAYAANTIYERHADADRRVALQMRLAADSWDPEIPEIAATEGWTHLLIHKPAPHPLEIPLAKTFENQRYSVYVFQ